MELFAPEMVSDHIEYFNICQFEMFSFITEPSQSHDFFSFR